MWWRFLLRMWWPMSRAGNMLAIGKIQNSRWCWDIQMDCWACKTLPKMPYCHWKEWRLQSHGKLSNQIDFIWIWISHFYGIIISWSIDLSTLWSWILLDLYETIRWSWSLQSIHRKWIFCSRIFSQVSCHLEKKLCWSLIQKSICFHNIDTHITVIDMPINWNHWKSKELYTKTLKHVLSIYRIYPIWHSTRYCKWNECNCVHTEF